MNARRYITVLFDFYLLHKVIAVEARQVEEEWSGYLKNKKINIT